MDCPKKDCDGQVEAWYKGTAFCDIDEVDLGESGEIEPILAGYGYDWKFTEFRCSQCDATWINKQQLLGDVAEKQEREKGETVELAGKGGDIDQ